MYPRLQELRGSNPKAANKMVTEIARGVHAGNADMTADGAAKMALDTAEEILVRLVSADTTVTMDDDK